MSARTDNVRDPALAAELLLARRGQAFWARTLNDLRDADFDAPSRVPGWTRRHLIAHVSFHARGLAHLVTGARTDSAAMTFESPEQREEEVAFGATLPVEALRNLAAHSAVHLNVEWRDLPEDRWSSLVRLPDGSRVRVSETVRLRAVEVWHHAVDLDNGATPDDIPAAMALPTTAEFDNDQKGPWCLNLRSAMSEKSQT